MKYILLSGSSNRPLALKIARALNKKLGKVEIEAFPNREIRVRVLENVKGKAVYIIQSTNYPAERYMIELALLANAVKRKGAKRIIAIIPWLGYSPQDKVFREGEPLSSKVVIRMLEATSINEFVVLDAHSNDVLRMFKKKVTHLSAMSVFIEYFKERLKGDWCSVALDNGSVGRATKFSKALELPLVRFEKSRNKKTGEVTFYRLKGNVEGKNIVTFDDFVSTGGTLIKSCDFLKEVGAKKCFYCISHIIVENTLKKIERSTIDKLFITDSISLDSRVKYKRLKVLSVAPLIADMIRSDL